MGYSVVKQWVYGVSLNADEAKYLYDVFEEEGKYGEIKLSPQEPFIITMLAEDGTDNLTYDWECSHIVGIVLNTTFASDVVPEVPEEIKDFFVSQVKDFLEQHNITTPEKRHLVVQIY